MHKDSFWYWRRLKRRIKRATVLAVRAGLVVSFLLSLLLWNWPEASDEVRRFLAPIGKAVRVITEREIGDVVRTATPKDEEPIRIYRGNRVEVLSGPERVIDRPVQVFRGSVTLSGPAQVIDGDTLDVGGVRVRLHGIDAPESAQTCLAGGERWRCGQRATRALRNRIDSRTVACEERDRGHYGRMVAVCRLGGSDLNAWMVSEGWALAYRRFSREYEAEEASAKAARRGLWRGDFVAPWDWRTGERLKAVRRETKNDTGQDTAECRIKGNISGKGARIYHVPGGRYYERTGINPSRGERWFCTEPEARAAGWRRSRR